MLFILLSLLQAYYFVEFDEVSNTQYTVTAKLIYIYSKPSLLSLPVGRLVKDQVIEGDKVEIHSNITWVSFLEKNKTRRYVIGKDIRGQCFLSPCPTDTVNRRYRFDELFEDELDEVSNTQYNVTTKLMYIYSKPTLLSLPVGRLVKGQVIEGDKVEMHSNITWVSFLEKNKTRRYVIGKDIRGQCFLNPCPEVPKIIIDETEQFDEAIEEEEELEEEYIDEFSDAWYEDEEPPLTETYAYKVTQRVLNVYNKPTLRSPIVGRWKLGGVIEADRVESHENLTWISYISLTGVRRYVIGKDYRGQCFVDPCPVVPEPEEPEFDALDTARCGNNVAFLQKDFATSCPAIKKSGCLFLATCYMGGLCTQSEVLNFWQWCVRNGRVRASDAYMLHSSGAVADECARMYGFARRPGSATSNSAKSHWWVVSGGKVVYNSVPGWF